MQIDPWILAFSAATVIATIWMGFRSARTSKTASDFFVAGRSVSVGWNASAISGEYLSAASFMGVAGMVMSSGYDALWYPVCYACGYLFLLLFIAGPLRRFGAYTIPDFAEGRFDSPMFRKIAVVFVLFIGFFYTMPQMKGAGTTLAYIFPGLPYWVGVVLVGAVITLNVALGGMKGITLVQAFQYWAKMFAISVPVFVLMTVYGHYGKQVGMNAQLQHAKSGSVRFKESSSGTEAWIKFQGNPEKRNRDGLFSRLKGKLLGETRMELGGIWSSGWGHSTKYPLTGLLDQFSKVSPKDVYLAVGLSETKLPSPRVGTLNAGSFEAYLKPALRSNGIAWVEIGKSDIKIVPDAEREGYLSLSTDSVRKPLPDKAPKDENWLNPFGPLTSKAAKAANAVPRWNLSAELRSRLVDSRNRPAPGLWESMGRSVKGFVENLGSSKSAPSNGSQFATFTNMATNATQSIRGGFPLLSALRELGRLLDHPVLVATNLPRPQLVISGSFQTREQFVNYLVALFLTNGVRLDLSGAAIKAIPAGDWELYRKNPASVILVPNHTFAMRVGPYDERRPDGSIVVHHTEPRMLLWNYGDVLGKRALMAANLPTNGVDFNPAFEVMLAHEAKAAMEQTLRQRGITIIPAGDKEVWAVPTAELARYQLPPVDPRPLSLLYTYSLIIALVCGTAGLPHILVRFYTNPDGVAAKRTTMWVMILIGVFYVFPPVFGVLGRNLMPDLYNGLTGVKGTDGIVLRLPTILRERYGALGSILSGVTCAGAFAAFMSTFSGLLVSMTGALAHDVYGRMLRPKSTPEQRLRAFKACGVLIGGIAIALGCFVEPLEINFMVGQAFAIAAASYFPLLFMSVWWRGMTMRGAATGMLAGGLCALAAVALTNVSNLALDKGPMGKVFAGFAPLNDLWAAHPLWRILCEQPAIWTVPLAIGLMMVVSRLTVKSVPADIRMKMLVLHAPEQLGLKQEYIQEQHSPH